MRVCGTFQQLVDELVIAGFAPLHYLLYWWIRQHTPLTPVVLRLTPAIAGTLMIPAMYWLAVQLVSRPTAILAAAFTACSAYMLNYSRDAKMYAELWLLVTVNMAAFLWWLRVRNRVSWWVWVTSGIAMLGVQTLGALILPIQLLVVLTGRHPHWMSLGKLLLTFIWLPFAIVLSWFGWERRGVGRWFARMHRNFNWPPLALFVLGIGVMGAGPAVYYVDFNVYINHIQSSPVASLNWFRSGIGWVEGYNADRDGTDLLAFTGTSFLDNWEWPQSYKQERVRERTLKLLKGSAIALGALLLIGVFPWRSWHWPRWRHDSSAGTVVVSPSVRPSFWLAAWLVLPTYGFYCASMRDALWPAEAVAQVFLKTPPTVRAPNAPFADSWAKTWQNWRTTDAVPKYFHAWNDALSQYFHAYTFANLRWWLLSILIATVGVWLFFVPLPWRHRLFRVGMTAQLVFVLFLLCMILRFAMAEPFPGSVWMPRYLGCIWPAFAIVVSVLLMRLPTRPLRWGAIALLLIVNLTQHGARVFAGSEPPTDLMARDALTSTPANGTRMYYRFTFRSIGDPGSGLLDTSSGRYYLALYTGRQVKPEEIRNFRAGFERDYGVWFAQARLPFEPIVAGSLKNAPTIKRIIVWEQLDPGQIELTDHLAEKLDPSWKLVSEALYPIRDHWTWRDLITARRRVYERRPVPSPGTAGEG
jgi:hypothetical protein